MSVRVRIAPSPTGFPHLGTIYQAIFNFAFAKKHSGKFIVRIEDTDRTRFVEGAEEVIFNSLKWFKLEADEDPIKGGPYAPYRSSERLDIYKKYIEQLIEKGYAYRCFCTKDRLEKMRQEQQNKGQAPRYDRHCLNLSETEINKNILDKTSFVVRMKIPDNEKIKVKDSLVGEVEFDSNTIDHQVILKSDGFPTYHLAVVVDDYLMEITHIFRGTEWLPSAPKHILLYKYLGWEKNIPVFTHLPLILNADGKGKLSKRDTSASVDFYIREGYLPEAVLNYLINIVWNHPESQEIFTLEEFIKLFEIKDLQPKGARFDLKKLEWVNGEYIRKMSDGELEKRLDEFLVDHPSKGKLTPLIPLVKDRIKKLSDFIPLTFFFFEDPEYDIEVFNKLKINNMKEAANKVLEVINKLDKPWDAKSFENAFRQLAEEQSLSASQIFQLIRVAISGQLVTPPLFESMMILGEEEAIERVKKTIQFLQTAP